MRKWIFPILPIALFAVFACSQSGVPGKAVDTFNAMFPGAHDVEWGKESDTVFEAEFEVDGREVSANFDAGGIWLETETMLSVSDLPGDVRDGVASRFSGSEVRKVERVERAGEPVQYEVLIATDENESEVILDADGTILSRNVVHKDEED